MNARSAFSSILTTARNHGVRSAAYDVAIRTVNHCIYYRGMHYFAAETVDPRSFKLPQGFRFLRLSDQALISFSKDPKYELQPAFLQYVLQKGDECYGIFDGDTLANYGWYSQRPTLIDTEDLFVNVGPRFVYMYKGFTLDRYRGLRLHAISKTRSLAEFQSRGFKGLISYVESNNFNSLKSSHRMGARPCGRIHMFRLMGKYVIRRDPACEQYGI